MKKSIIKQKEDNDATIKTLNNNNDDLKKQIISITNDNTKFLDNANINTNTIKELRDNIINLENQLNEMNNNNNNNDNDNVKILTKQLDEANAHINNLSIHLNTELESNKANKAKVSSLEDDLKMVFEQLTTQSDSLEKITKLYNKLNDEHKEKCDQLDVTVMQFNEALILNSKQEVIITSNTKELRELEHLNNEVIRLNTIIRDAEDHKQALKQYVENAAIENEKLKLQISQLNQALINVEEEGILFVLSLYIIVIIIIIKVLVSKEKS